MAFLMSPCAISAMASMAPFVIRSPSFPAILEISFAMAPGERLLNRYMAHLLWIGSMMREE